MSNTVWLQAYDDGVPHEIGGQTGASVADYIEHCCQQYPELPAIQNFGTDISYRQFADQASAFAGYLQERLALGKGERIAVMLPNMLQFPIAVFGALKAGLVVVNMNPLSSEREVLTQLKDSGAAAVVIYAGSAHTLQRVLGETDVRHVIVTQLGDLMPFPKSLLLNAAVRYVKRTVPAWNIPQAIPFCRTLSSGHRFRPIALTPDDLAFLQYTGGTTGTPKGAMLSHANVLANIEQTYVWTRQHLRPTRERAIIALPLYHIFALTISFLSSLKFGGLHILVTDPRNIAGLVKEMRLSRFSVFAGVNTLFKRLLDDEGFRRLDFAPLRFTLGGGAAIQSAVAERWQQLTATPICQAYGLTEASPGVSCNPLSCQRFNGTVGVPVSSTQVEIRDDRNRVVPFGTPGALFVKGPQVMQGYWRAAKETAAVLSTDGWLDTGDIATMDERGFLRIVDRNKDLIIVSGFNVYPTEVEEVLTRHTAIRDAAVIGIPDRSAGEAVKAFVVKDADALSEQTVIDYCKTQLSPYKVPRRVEFIDEIPRSTVGKVLHRRLREP